MKRPLLAVLGWVGALVMVFAACASGPNATPAASFAPRPSNDPAAVGGIEGAQWWLIDLDGSAVPASPRIELVLKSGKATGSGGCNSYGGDYTIDGQRIRFGEIGSTAMGCLEPGVLEREAAFHRALRDARTWALDARGLSLLDAGGDERAVFESVFGRPPPPSGGASLTPEASARASLSAADVVPEELADAIRFRRSFGLRADVGYVAAVAEDPSAVLDYGVPLLPAEKADIDHRVDGDELGLLTAYGEANTDTFAGLYLDQAAGGVVIVRFTGDLTRHLAVVPQLLPGRVVIVRGARFTEAELRLLQDQISGDIDAIRQMGGALQSVGVDPIGNVVQVEVSSADPGFPARLAARYGADRVRVIADGTGIGRQPLGRIVGKVVDGAGRPLAGIDVEVEPLERIGMMAGTGHVTQADGSFVISDLPPVLWRVEAGVAGTNGMDWLAHADVRVPPGGVANVTLTIPGEPKPAP